MRVSTANVGRRRWENAFSVLEIMVAVALLSVIIVGLLAMFYQVQRAFRAGTAQVDVMEGGRATMNLLTRDLQGMTAANSSFITNCVIIPTPTNTFTSQELSSGAPRDNVMQDVCFLSRNNDDWIGVAYRFSNSVSGLGTLYRRVIVRQSDSHPDTNFWIVSDLSLQLCTSTPYNAPDRYNRVLDGVVSLRITPFDTNGVIYADNDPTRAPAATDAFGNTNANVHVINDAVAGSPSPVGFFEFFSNALPAYLDIELSILEPSAIEKFNARVDPALAYPQSIDRATNYLARQIGRIHVFRQRVAVRPSSTDIGTRFDLASP